MSFRKLASHVLLLAATAFAAAAWAQEGQGDVVYVPTPQVAVDEMLKLAKVGPNDFVIDLGSGDGRIIITAAKKLGARGFGVDLDTYLLKVANAAAQKEGVADRAQFVEQNLFETDLSKATVITTYLLPEMNERLRPKLLALKPGTRVVAHDYDMGEWTPDEQKTLIVPEKKVGDPGKSYVFFWVVPARIAGTWQSQISVAGKPVAYEFTLAQEFQMLDGSGRAGNQSGVVKGRMAGTQVRFTLSGKAGDGLLRHEFQGRVTGDDAIEGVVHVGEGAKRQQYPWTAKRTQRAAAVSGALARNALP
ncbi:MAG: hypothetical protein A2W68_01400 [Betaproteobacteria bacterium RIFCSPLOWO2_02_64_14]|nr:MAG: hypothetical protein A2W68_01400 [Betaproteobacteria bacterium RIFCSPLOWO2_02_64_14]